MKRLLRGLLLTLVVFMAFLGFTGTSQAEWQSTYLDGALSYFAGRNVIVLCHSEAEDPFMSTAWGYVYKPTKVQKETFLHEQVCMGALSIDLDVPEVSDEDKVLGVQVLVHEAFHLKDIWNAQSEKITECRAFRNYDKGFHQLGAEPEVLDRLMPLAIRAHFSFVTRVPEYNWKHCETPLRYAKWMP